MIHRGEELPVQKADPLWRGLGANRVQGRNITGRWNNELLTPIIPALWEAKVGRSPEVGSLRPA